MSYNEGTLLAYGWRSGPFEKRPGKYRNMAKNGAKGGGRKGAIRGRTQFLLPNGHYAKRDRKTGEIISVKADTKPYKGVVREPSQPRPQPLGQ